MRMTLWFIFCKDEILLKKISEDSYNVPQGETSPIKLKEWNNIHNVSPMNDGTLVKTVRVDEPVFEVEGMEMKTLRQSYYFLSPEIYQKAGKCHELLYWDANTKFCGVCGAPMKWHTEISKRCSECGKEVWPLLATAIIVLIHKGNDEVLLVRGKNFRSEFFGLVAGFVETGESLEEAVHREVMEEVGLKISNLRYFSSQPWPYPCGLMVGFHADYVSGEIKLQREEIAKGGWFRRNNLPTIPEKLSIARQLIDNWLGEDEIK